MEQIIPKIYKLLKETDHLIEFEEKLHLLMQELFTSLVGDVFTSLNQVIKEQKQAEGWKVERNDGKGMQFTFGEVRYKRTLMYDKNGDPRYPLDEWLGFRKRQKYSPLVEVKVAELASKNDYRESARILKEWTAVDMSHTTVGCILRRVGGSQSLADKEMVQELEESASLPDGKRVDFLYAEADGVFVRGLKKKKHIEVSNCVLYEGWDKNGKRVSLHQPKVIMTTQSIDQFWDEVQTIAAHKYSLENTQIVSNSDGGKGYSANRFQNAFSQSQFAHLHQLDAYHIAQAINRTFGYKESELKDKINQAIKDHNLEDFQLILDTFESSLEDEQAIEKVKKFQTYIVGHWDYVKDWRKRISNPPKDARGLGAIESKQRKFSFHFKKRGEQCSYDVSEVFRKMIYN